MYICTSTSHTLLHNSIHTTCTYIQHMCTCTREIRPLRHALMHKYVRVQVAALQSYTGPKEELGTAERFLPKFLSTSPPPVRAHTPAHTNIHTYGHTQTHRNTHSPTHPRTYPRNRGKSWALPKGSFGNCSASPQHVHTHTGTHARTYTYTHANTPAHSLKP